MALKLVVQDVATLRLAYEERCLEYDCLRTAGRWAGAVYLSGILVEIAFKIIIGKHMGVSKLPDLFKVHDLELLRYCSGLENSFASSPELHTNFSTIHNAWTIDLRYRGSEAEIAANDVHKALYEPPDGLLTFLSRHF